MSGFKWTEDQRAAVLARPCSILVSAAAGAGKTQVLTGRIINRIINDGVDIDSLLIVTFTKAAAAEMRERISGEISKALSENPSNSHLRRQLMLLHSANITTIHSFCLDIVRQNFFRAGIDPNFRVADSAESELIKLEALDSVLEEMYSEGDPDFLQLCESYAGSRSDKELADMILSVYDFVQSMPWREKWLDDCTAAYETDAESFKKSPQARLLMHIAAENLKSALALCRLCLEKAAADPELASYVLMLEADIAMLEEILSSKGDWDTFYEMLRASFSKRKSIKGAGSETKAYVDGLRDSAKNLLKSAQKLISGKAEDLAEQISFQKGVIRALTEAVKRLIDKFSQLKRERGVLDFDDLEHIALEILSRKEEDGSIVPSEAALELRDRFEEIYIDEYQDSNLVQETIFELISRGNIFMVGDMKQSIYRFRQADPTLFKEKKENYPLHEDSPRRQINLTLNFRSRKTIIDNVNHVFSMLMSEETGELDYNESEQLRAGATFCAFENPAAEASELCVIDLAMNEPEDEDEDAAETITNIQAEARLVAQKINELMRAGFCVWDKTRGEKRPLRYGDIAVLMRSPSGRAQVFETELTEAGIPVFCDTDGGYFETLEIKLFLSLLQIIDNPLQDIPLIAVLRSVIFGFTPDELAKIREYDTENLFYFALSAAAKEETPLGKKCSEFLSRLGQWRKRAMRQSVSAFVEYLLSDTNYYSFVGALSGGERRQANLRLLSERAAAFEKTSYRGLMSFLSFIDKARASGGDMGSAKDLGEHSNVVRIMSIHKSKGLEFPVVILSGCGTRFNRRDTNANLVMHKNLGMGLNIIDTKRRIRYTTSYRNAISKQIELEAVSEELRILYVGMTRAKEMLIITGICQNFARAVQRAQSALCEGGRFAPYDVQRAGSFLMWLIMAIENRDKSRLPSHWKVNIYGKGALSKTEEKAEESFLSGIEKEPSDYVKERLGFTYAYRELEKMPAKMTVTELKRLDEDEYIESAYVPPLMELPPFLKDKKTFSAAERGSLLHFFMQHLDFNTGDLGAELERMKAFLSPEQIRAIDLGRVRRFLDSEIGKRLRRAGKVYRETPFTLRVPHESIKGEYYVLQGIIDCFFEENDKLILLDYKTDCFDDPEEMRQKYQKQIDIYALALEKKFSKRVDEKLLYLFYDGSIIRL